MHLGVLYPPSQHQCRYESSTSRQTAPFPATPPTRRPSSRVATIPRRRAGAPLSAAAASGPPPPSDSSSPKADPAQKRAEIAANVERAAAMVGEIVNEVTRELFVSEAVAYLKDDRADQTELAAVRAAVARRLDFLDANFLTTLSGFAAAASRRGDAPLAALLGAVHDEVLRQVSARMPAAAQVLDLALRHADKDQRVAVLRTAAAATTTTTTTTTATQPAVPPADLDTLAATASKFIDEMEEQAEIPDRRLLARLVLLREEVRLLREEARFNAGLEHGSDGLAAEEPVRTNVPQRCAAFLKELVAVGEPLRRVALLARAFESDWDGAAPRQKPQTSFHANQPDWVRPGRLLATLQSMVVQLQQQQEAEGGGGGGGGSGTVAVIARLEEIRSEAMAVLDRMHTAGSSGGGGGGDEGSGGSEADGGSGGGGADEGSGGADGGSGGLPTVEPTVL
ncbi:hypothetical protein PLESTF_001640200 [Pleodorina starrii]|nr:hypothetical protein PLESTM_000628700 [Pleodorina starrii]GLC75460.1 hypothetical protein PLESTF_001640200 [Pleodorina starrii]